jgi:glutamate N-acetyltransferase/amino-acid N-acetyltransferase
LPVEKIISVIARDEIPKQSIKAFAQSILTTDTFMKIAQDSKANFLGFAKGSGMIHPNMATMLAFVITDKKIKGFDEVQSKVFMQDVLKAAIDKSFNSITVDGDTSTNDMCLLMNNLTGAEISEEEFMASLTQVCTELAYKVVADGEGLTKLSVLKINSNLDAAVARELGRFILNSSLVKTALHGNDPNWGRIIASLGQYAAQEDLDIDINQVKLSIFSVVLFENGMNTDFDRTNLIQKMKKAFELDIVLELGGSKSITVFGNDLSYEYIRINAEYFT